MKRATSKKALQAEIGELTQLNEVQASVIKQYQLEHLQHLADMRCAVALTETATQVLTDMRKDLEEKSSALDAYAKMATDLRGQLWQAQENGARLNAELQRAMDLASERGKINSILVEKIRSLEAG